jgi:hypothetical protein
MMGYNKKEEKSSMKNLKNKKKKKTEKSHLDFHDQHRKRREDPKVRESKTSVAHTNFSSLNCCFCFCCLRMRKVFSCLFVSTETGVPLWRFLFGCLVSRCPLILSPLCRDAEKHGGGFRLCFGLSRESFEF